jgi:hypothetical protein
MKAPEQMRSRFFVNQEGLNNFREDYKAKTLPLRGEYLITSDVSHIFTFGKEAVLAKRGLQAYSPSCQLHAAPQAVANPF